MKECPNCGSRISLGQKYCEECGTELSMEKVEAPVNPQIQKYPESPIVNPITSSLFDINRDYYIIKERWFDLGYGDILDEKGQLIGKMNRIIFSIRRRVELQELDGTIAATIHSKIVTARGAQDLKDAQGNMIARIKRKILTFFHHTFYLEDPFGNRWYEAEGDFMGWSFKVYEVASRKLIAEIEKADRWRDVFLRGIFDFKDTYALRILDNETDRRILVGFVLSIDNVLHDQGGMGPMVGPGLFIAGSYRRARFPGPFGPPRRRRY
jgi:uncharacterized protein YxjI